MFSRLECLDRAEELDRLALECPSAETRAAYKRIARNWRSTAALAAQHEELLALNGTA